MRAVKYGVTRHQVLGLEAVLATGEVIRTGGKFVKATTGYDLTQLIIGSEGTLALVTEATLRLYPRAPHQATVLAPFLTLDAVTHAVPRIVASGVGPMILEYIDMITLSAPSPPTSGSTSGSRATSRTVRSAYLVVMMEQMLGRPSRRGRRGAGRAAGRARGARRLRAARGAAASAHRRAGEVLLGRQGQPRRRHRRHRRAAGLAPRVHGDRSPPSRPRPARGSPDAATPATGTCTSRCSRPTPRSAPGRCTTSSGRHGARRRDLRRARHRTGEAALLPRARGPGQARADAPHQGRLRPDRGILNPGILLDLDPNGTVTNPPP